MAHGDTPLSREELPAHPSSVLAARRLVRGWLADSGNEELTEGAELAVSELVTNALVHAGTAVEMRAHVDPGFLRVEVVDGSTYLPRVREHLDTSGTGRGLRLLERTVDRWGAHLDGDGKVVWFELSADGEPVQELTEAAAVDRDLRTVPIDLLDVPLLLHAAWQGQAETLLREHLLVNLEDDPERTLEIHATAGDALSLLSDQIPTPTLGADPDAVMAYAVGPAVTADHLVLRVPLDAVASFDVLDATLDEASDLAERGLLLAPPNQPEIRQMRRWLCGQVRDQAAGGPATGWVTNGHPLPAPVRELAWDPSAVDGSDRALVAADDTNRIVGASVPALELLGFDTRGALVGQRLLGLIPARYHQAHLAGFTLHLTTGRSPMLGVPMTLPVLLRDGSERLVDLTVTAHHVDGGRQVFVAEMTAPAATVAP